MANFLLTGNSKFDPFTLKDMLAVNNMWETRHQQLEAEYDKLNEQANVWEKLANSEIDRPQYEIYKAFSDKLSSASDDLATRGVNASNRKTLSSLKKAFASDIKPMDEAYKAREVMKNAILNGSLNGMIYNVAPERLSMDQFMGGKRPELKGLDINKEYQKAVDAFGTFSDKFANIEKLDGPQLDKYLGLYQTKFGISNEDITAVKNAIMTGNTSKITDAKQLLLNTAYDELWNQSGIDSWEGNQNANKDQLRSTYMRAMTKAMGKDTPGTYTKAYEKAADDAARDLQTYEGKKQIDLTYKGIENGITGPYKQPHVLRNAVPVRTAAENATLANVNHLIKNGIIQQDSTGKYTVNAAGLNLDHTTLSDIAGLQQRLEALFKETSGIRGLVERSGEITEGAVAIRNNFQKVIETDLKKRHFKNGKFDDGWSDDLIKRRAKARVAKAMSAIIDKNSVLPYLSTLNLVDKNNNIRKDVSEYISSLFNDEKLLADVNRVNQYSDTIDASDAPNYINFIGMSVDSNGDLGEMDLSSGDAKIKKSSINFKDIKNSDILSKQAFTKNGKSYITVTVKDDDNKHHQIVISNKAINAEVERAYTAEESTAQMYRQLMGLDFVPEYKYDRYGNPIDIALNRDGTVKSTGRMMDAENLEILETFFYDKSNAAKAYYDQLFSTTAESKRPTPSVETEDFVQSRKWGNESTGLTISKMAK